MSDDEAIQRLKSGDMDGLETLVTRYQMKALKTAFLIVHDLQMAEDVVQETFVRLYHHIDRFDVSKPFEPYLMRSVINAALNALKQGDSYTQVGSPSDFDELEIRLAQADSVETQTETRQQREDILAALRQLPPRQRAVIVQRYYLEMSEKDMAQGMGTPPGTVKWLLNEARRRLRELMSPKGAWKNE